MTGPAVGQECLYVLNQLENSVTAVRRNSHAIIASVPMPVDDCPAPPCNPFPTAIEFSAATARAYVSRQDVNLLYVLDPVAKEVVDTVTIDSGSGLLAASSSLALSPNGASLYVTNLAADSVSVIATGSNELVDTITVGNQPRAVAFTPDGTTALVGNTLDDNLSIIGTAAGEVIGSIDVGNAPAGIAITADGARAYVSNGNDQSVSVVDIASRAVVDTISVGEAPRGVVLTPDGASLFVTNVLGPPGLDNEGTVSVIDTAAGEVSGEPIPVGNGPVAIAVSDDGAELYVANLMGNTVSVINVANRAVERIAGLNAPFDLALGPCPPPDVSCVGDCNGGGEVSIGELITGVNISLGDRPFSSCTAYDTDDNEMVSIAELIRAVNNALNGCPV